jgi:predicted nucleic acid-binding Zn ribbon protein
MSAPAPSASWVAAGACIPGQAPPLRPDGNMHSPEHTCLVCGSPFTAKRSDAKTCSARCRQRLSRGQSPERKHPRYAKAWVPLAPAKVQHYEQPPQEYISGEPDHHALEIVLFDLALEIGQRFDRKTGRFEWRRWRRAHKLWKAHLREIETKCSNGADLNLVREMVRVERAIRTTVREVKEHMDEQRIIEAMREEHERTRHELTLAIYKARDGETPSEAAERILVEAETDGEASA